MAAVNYTPISLYYSTTAAAAPIAGNLALGELGINVADADMAMYAKNASGVVKRLINNPAGLKYPTVDGTNGQALVTNGSGTLSFGSAGVSAGYAKMPILFPNFICNAEVYDHPSTTYFSSLN